MFIIYSLMNLAYELFVPNEISFTTFRRLVQATRSHFFILLVTFLNNKVFLIEVSSIILHNLVEVL